MILFLKSRKSSLNLIAVGLLFFLIFGLWYPIVSFLNDLQFLIVSVFVVYILFRALIKHHSFHFIKIDFVWLLFLVLCAVSFCYTVNNSNAISYTMFWLLCFCFSISIRQLALSKTLDFLYRIGPLIFALVCVHICGLIFFQGLPSGNNWQAFVGKNDNYLACYTLTLIPLIVYKEYESKWLKMVVNSCSFGFTLLVILITKSIGVLLALLVFLIYYYRSNIKRHYKLCFIAGSVVLISLIGLSKYFPDSFNELFSELSYYRQASRAFMFTRSIEIINENILTGVGIGNWIHLVYDTDLSDCPPFNSPHTFIRHRNHNLLLLMFSELGIFGLLCHFIPIFYLLFGKRIKPSLSFAENQMREGLKSIVIIYLILSCFYVTINFQEFSFSAINIIVYGSLGLLSKDFAPSRSFNKTYLILISILSVATLFWFGRKAYENNTYYKAKSLIKKEPEQALANLQKIYIPGIVGQHSFENSYGLMIAELFEKQGDVKNAGYHYSKALEQAPFDLRIMIPYSKFKYHKLNDFDSAKQLALKAYGIQPTSSILNIWLTELSIIEKDRQKALLYIENIEKTKDLFGGKIYLRFAERLRSRIDIELPES